jgi:hypothetical protein
LGWVAAHVAATGVERPSRRRHAGNDALLLATRGGKSHLLGRTTRFYAKGGERYAVAANGGASTYSACQQGQG